MSSPRTPTANGPPPRAVQERGEDAQRQQLPETTEVAEPAGRPTPATAAAGTRAPAVCSRPEDGQREAGEQERLEHQLGAVAHGRSRATPARAARSPRWRRGVRASRSGRPRGVAPGHRHGQADAEADGQRPRARRRATAGRSRRATPSSRRSARLPRRNATITSASAAFATPEQRGQLDESGRPVRLARPLETAMPTASAGHHDRGLSTRSATADARGRPPGGHHAALRCEVDRRDAADVDQRQHRARPEQRAPAPVDNSCAQSVSPWSCNGDAETPDSSEPCSGLRQHHQVGPGGGVFRRIGSDSPVATKP